ncbi:hypothetical protein V5E97_11315 [Singulisphaera sp. Ch08]|uniref:Uncharacterized protein n=1 Tax=Singulisphaera sp. Ch08 TaxID=3120278 RepID=A0AAU7CNA4_9BACT
MPDAAIPPPTLALIELIATAIRNELGVEIDAYPGQRQPERADPLNRGFRAVARVIVRHIVGPDASPDLVSLTLLQATQRRLTSEGWEERQVRFLIELESGYPDDWLTFLLLSSRPQIEPLLDPDATNPN